MRRKTERDYQPRITEYFQQQKRISDLSVEDKREFERLLFIGEFDEARALLEAPPMREPPQPFGLGNLVNLGPEQVVIPHDLMDLIVEEHDVLEFEVRL